MSVGRPATVVAIGDVVGHWRVIAELGRRPSAKNRDEEHFRVQSLCGKQCKEISKSNLARSGKLHDLCKACSPRTCGNGRKPGFRSPNGYSNRIRGLVLHRCNAVEELSARTRVTCGAPVRPEEMRQHLWLIHGLRLDDPAAAFGPALTNDGDEEEAA